MHLPVTSRISWLGLSILPGYLLVTLLIGWSARRRPENSNALLNASRSLPLWVVSAAFLAANCGALEIVGLSAVGAQYGAQAFHFYWIGAIPAMVFLSLWMLPAYVRSSIRSVPEFLAARFGASVQLVNGCVVAAATLMLAGISLYAMAQVLLAVLGLPFFAGVLLSAGSVLVYVLIGGVRATIYTEVFQLAVMLAGLVPLWLRTLLFTRRHPEVTHSHLWDGWAFLRPQAPTDHFGVVLGLGFVLSFGYWCTDFVLMQRALAARTELEARQVPLWAGFGKLAFSLIVVVPALVAPAVLPALGHTQRFDQALPRMMTVFYGPTLLGLGLTALASSLMSGFAANISGFSSVWTLDIYRHWLAPGRSEAHYLRVGRRATVAAVLISLATSYVSFFFNNLMDHVQMIFSLTNAPFWALFLLALFRRRARARSALAALACGTGFAAVHHWCVYRHLLRYGSMMSANFHVAVYSFTVTLCLGWLLRARDDLAQTATPQPVFASARAPFVQRDGSLLWLSGALLILTVALNVYWR
jgi:solute:Na+ symporter, SSS family